jgi:hypothetical protein
VRCDVIGLSTKFFSWEEHSNVGVWQLFFKRLSCRCAWLNMSKPFECNVVRFREPADKMCGSDRTSTFVHVPFQSRRMRPNNNRNNRPNFFFFFLFSGVDLAKNLLGGREWSNGYHPDDYLVYPSRSTRVMIDPSMTALKAFEGHIVVIHTGLSIAGRLQPVWITILTQVRIFNIPTILWLVLIVSY